MFCLHLLKVVLHDSVYSRLKHVDNILHATHWNSGTLHSHTYVVNVNHSMYLIKAVLSIVPSAYSQRFYVNMVNVQ